MRMSTLKCFIYRELFLARKSLFSNGLSALFIMVFGIMVSLSTKYGNLRLVPENYQDVLGDMLFLFSSFLPVYTCALAGMSILETIQLECDKKWSRFRLTTPVSGYLFVLARYIVLLGSVAVFTLFALVYMWGNSVIMGEPVSRHSITFMLAITLSFLSFTLLMQLLTMVLGSLERAGIVMLVVMIPVICVVMFKFMESGKMPTEPGMSFNVSELLGSYLPHVFATFVVTLIVSFILSAKLYKRREK